MPPGVRFHRPQHHVPAGVCELELAPRASCPGRTSLRRYWPATSPPRLRTDGPARAAATPAALLAPALRNRRRQHRDPVVQAGKSGDDLCRTVGAMVQHDGDSDVGAGPPRFQRGGRCLDGTECLLQVPFLIVRGHRPRPPGRFAGGPAQATPGHRSAPRSPRLRRMNVSSTKSRSRIQCRRGPPQAGPGQRVDCVAVELPAGNGVPPVAQQQRSARRQRCGDPVEQLRKFGRRQVIADFRDNDQVKAAVRPLPRNRQLPGLGAGVRSQPPCSRPAGQCRWHPRPGTARTAVPALRSGCRSSSRLPVRRRTVAQAARRASARACAAHTSCPHTPRGRQPCGAEHQRCPQRRGRSGVPETGAATQRPRRAAQNVHETGPSGAPRRRAVSRQGLHLGGVGPHGGTFCPLLRRCQRKPHPVPPGIRCSGVAHSQYQMGYSSSPWPPASAKSAATDPRVSWSGCPSLAVGGNKHQPLGRHRGAGPLPGSDCW